MTLLLFLGQESLDPESLMRRHGEGQTQPHVGWWRNKPAGTYCYWNSSGRADAEAGRGVPPRETASLGLAGLCASPQCPLPAPCTGDAQSCPGSD